VNRDAGKHLVGDARQFNRRPIVGYALYITAATLFALNGSTAKILLESGIPAARLSQVRVTAAMIILVVIVALTNRPAFRLRRSEIRRLLIYGVLGIVMTQWLYFVALDRGLPVGVALLIEFTAPIMVALWFRFGLKEAVGGRVWWALILALIGLAMVAQIWQGFTLDVIGVAAAFAAAVALVVYYVAGEKAVNGKSARDPVSLTMWGFVAAAAFWAIVQPWWTFPWNVFGGVSTSPGILASVPQPLLLTYMVVLGTVVPFWLVVSSMRHLRASQASTVGMSEPVIASFFAFVLLGEVLTPVQLLGGAVVLLGVYLAERAR